MSIKNYLERTSVRNFTKEKMTEKEIETITKVINNAPTSTNNQQFSAIIITDQKIKNFISKNNWGQKHIAECAAFIVFVADKTRVNYIMDKKKIDNTNKDMQHHEFFRGVVDATIAATYAQDALIEMGFGVTFVGGILAFGQELNDLLKLPESAFAVVGLSIGKPEKVHPTKPRMNKVFMNKYSKTSAIKEVEKYNKDTVKYFEGIKTPDHFTQVANTADATSPYAKAFIKGGKYVAKKYKEYK